MKKAALAVVVGCLLIPGVVSAQAGYLGLYSDQAGTGCYLYDMVSVHTVYVIHKMTAGAVASQWKVQGMNGFTMVYVGEATISPIVIHFGNTQIGILLGYGSCLSGDIVLASIYYFGLGTSAPCSYLEIVGDPASATGTIEVTDCSMNVVTVGATPLYINPDGNCDCVNPVEQGSWGRIKALYSN